MCGSGLSIWAPIVPFDLLNRDLMFRTLKSWYVEYIVFDADDADNANNADNADDADDYLIMRELCEQLRLLSSMLRLYEES